MEVRPSAAERRPLPASAASRAARSEAELPRYGCAGDGTPLRKGGVVRIDFDGTPKPGAGRLVWMMTPKLLRRVGRAG